MKQAIVFLMVVAGLTGSSTVARAQFLKALANNFTKGLTSKQTANSPKTGNATDSAARHLTAADSAAQAGVAQQFMSASGGSGMMYQYQTKYEIRTKTRDSVLVDTMMTAIGDNRFSHTDIDIMGVKMTVLGRPGQTGPKKYSVILYPQTRKYKVNLIDTAKLNGGNGQTYQVTRIGAETVAGYSCVHARLTIGGANKKSVLTEDIWTSSQVPGYSQLKQDIANANVSVKMMQALQQAGCDGMVVKVSGGVQQMSFQMVLVSAQRKSFPASMFVIPAGYVEM